MTAKARYAAGVVLIASLGMLCAAIATYRSVSPTFTVRLVEMETYTAEVPTHWDDSSHETNPRLISKTSLRIQTHPVLEDERPLEWSLRIEDRGPGVSVETETQKLRPSSASPVEKFRFKNGITASTWDYVVPAAHLEIPFKNYVFQASNGHLYHASHMISPRWKERWRYNNLFRRVLGSMKFKDAPTPAKK